MLRSSIDVIPQGTSVVVGGPTQPLPVPVAGLETKPAGKRVFARTVYTEPLFCKCANLCHRDLCTLRYGPGGQWDPAGHQHSIEVSRRNPSGRHHIGVPLFATLCNHLSHCVWLELLS